MELQTSNGTIFTIDDEDFEKVKGFNWHSKRDKRTTYVRAQKKTKGICVNTSLHRLLMNAPDGIEVDHIDGNGLNNRKANLRLCSHRQNQYNRKPNLICRSGFKGVSWNEEKKRWRAAIRINGKRTFIGNFKTKEEAAIVYNKAAERLYGEFARLNVLGSFGPPDKAGNQIA